MLPQVFTFNAADAIKVGSNQDTNPGWSSDANAGWGDNNQVAVNNEEWAYNQDNQVRRNYVHIAACIRLETECSVSADYY